MENLWVVSNINQTRVFLVKRDTAEEAEGLVYALNAEEAAEGEPFLNEGEELTVEPVEMEVLDFCQIL